MPTTELTTWVREMRALLADLQTQDLGYEIGTNDIWPPATSVPAALPLAFHRMYRVFDGLSLPDVHTGYFIDKSARAVSATERGLPTRLSSAPQRHIHVFGSDGGGGLFAMDTEDETVFHLPSDGVIEGGTFAEGTLVQARRIAGGIPEFLDLLKRDVHAFVEGNPEHRYITSR